MKHIKKDEEELVKLQVYDAEASNYIRKGVI